MNRYILTVQRFSRDIEPERHHGELFRMMYFFRMEEEDAFLHEQSRRRQKVLNWLIEQEFDHYYTVHRVDVPVVRNNVEFVSTVDIIMVVLNNDDEAMFMKMRHTKQPLPRDFDFSELVRHNLEGTQGCWI